MTADFTSGKFIVLMISIYPVYTRPMLRSSLRSFHAVAHHGGFSRAAKKLNISQPTLSTQVKALEERYAVELFARAGRTVQLTAQGRELFEVTSRLNQAEVDAERLLDAFRGLTAGKLNIAAVGPFHATDMIVTYKQKYPLIDIEVRFGNSTLCFERILSLRRGYRNHCRSPFQSKGHDVALQHP